MKNLKKATTKQMSIDKTKAQLFAIVAGATIVSVFCLVAAKGYLSEASFLNRVADAKEKTLSQLEQNKKSSTELVAAYKTFAGSDPNLIGGAKSGTGDRDGDNGKLVLDALPSKYDFPALTASLEKLLKGYTINSITGSDTTSADAAAVSTTTTPTTTTTTTADSPVVMPFTVDTTSDFNGMKNLVISFEKSIRPFQFVTYEMKASSDNTVQATITANTYYLPEKNLMLGTKVVK